MRYYIGIDPGEKGGIAFLSEDGGVISVSKMPPTPRDIYDYLAGLLSHAASCSSQMDEPRVVCYLEDVGHGMPGQSSSATAKFARHCGHLEMALLSLRIPVNTITPAKWMKSYQLGRSGDYTKTEWKNRLKSKAQQLFPQLGGKVTLSTSDALLIAEYGRKADG